MICRDVLATDTAKITRGGQPVMMEKVEEVIRKFCESPKPVKANFEDPIKSQKATILPISTF